MSQLGQIISLTTDPAAHYTDGIAQNAQDLEDLALDLSICGTPTARCRIVGLSVVSVQNLDWELWLWRKAAGAGAGIGADSFIGYWSFLGANAKQIGGAGRYYYFIPGLDIPYTDEDTRDERPDPLAPVGRIHLGLVNRSAVAKLAGDAGMIKITLLVDPTHG